jgi:hypothetical protein
MGVGRGVEPFCDHRNGDNVDVCRWRGLACVQVALGAMKAGWVAVVSAMAGRAYKAKEEKHR